MSTTIGTRAMDANNSRDQTLEQRLKSQLTTGTPWTSTAVRIAAETLATARDVGSNRGTLARNLLQRFADLFAPLWRIFTQFN
jgi:hypothetical protein